jgi:hypothetical protein
MATPMVLMKNRYTLPFPLDSIFSGICSNLLYKVSELISLYSVLSNQIQNGISRGFLCLI